MKQIPLDELILAFTDMLAEVNTEMKERYAASPVRRLNITGARIKTSALPVLKKEKDDGLSRVYLVFDKSGDPQRLSFEIDLKNTE